MNKLRKILLILSLAFGSLLIIILAAGKYNTPMKTTLSPAFMLLGKPIGYTNHALTKILPVGEADEKEYGDAIRLRYGQYETNDKNNKYVNVLIKHLSKNKKKSFPYTVYIINESYMNAFALPGGVIFITEGLINNLSSESELAGVIAHEIGHIELSHCLDTVRMELVARKIGMAPAGELADFAVNILFRHSYSKTQEDAADEYAFALLKETKYTPFGISNAFKSMINEYPSDQKTADVIKEYFMSHPHLELRADKFEHKAKEWLDNHEGEKRYLGELNIQNKISFYQKTYEDEWIYGADE